MSDDRQAQINEALGVKLTPYLDNLPEPVRLVIWGDEQATLWEAEAVKLGRALAQLFSQVQLELRPRLDEHGYYPVLGPMQPEGEQLIDHGIRIVGSPVGYQIMTVVGALQAIAFRGRQLEGRTRIHAFRLPSEVTIQLFTRADDEQGPAMSAMICNLAVINPLVQVEIVMADIYPEIAMRFDPQAYPAAIINRRVHIRGPVDEDVMMQQIAAALSPGPLAGEPGRAGQRSQGAGDLSR